jgi:uncharacterized protein (TIGR00269 family)
MQLPKCSFCDRNAAWKRPWDKENLCIMHFNQSFLKRVQKTINQYHLFERNDKIAVGISGGKDSIVLLDVITKLQKNHHSEIIAITIDEGISGYREDGLKFAIKAAKKAGVKHEIFSFEDRFGATLDDTLILLGNNGKRLGACSYCGVFRRKLLNEAAMKVGATKLATGHNADDEAQTVFMNMIRGDLLKTLRSNPKPEFKDKKFVPRVKPFRWTSEQEIVLYAHFNKLDYQEIPCPNAIEAQRGTIRDILTDLKETTPDVIFSILHSADKLLNLANLVNPEDDPLNIVPKNPKPCSDCGEPSVKGRCRACIIQDKIKDVKSKNDNLTDDNTLLRDLTL